MDIELFRSRFHIEINPSNYGFNDVHVMQHTMKESTQTGLGSIEHKLVVVVLNEAEKMTHAAQHALRRTMEKASGHCRLIMCCSNLTQVDFVLVYVLELF